MHRLIIRTKRLVNSTLCLNGQGLTSKEKKMNKKHWVFALSFMASMVVVFLSPVFFPQLSPTVFARQVCDAGWQYDIQSTGLSYKPLSDPKFLRNPSGYPNTLDFTVTKTKTVTASFDAQIAAESGLLFEKVHVQFGVTLSKSTSTQTTVTDHYTVAPHTTIKMTYMARINSYQVHKYFLSKACTTSRDSYSQFSAPAGEEFFPKEVKIS
jgi:hypothetical protein